MWDVWLCGRLKLLCDGRDKGKWIGYEIKCEMVMGIVVVVAAEFGIVVVLLIDVDYDNVLMRTH